MFILTTKSTITELRGTVHADDVPSYTGTYRVVMAGQCGTHILGEYAEAFKARRALADLAIAITRGDNLFVMPDEGVVIDNNESKA